MSKKNLGIFGGSFNPIHNGHINSIRSVSEQLNLDLVLVIPSLQSPNKAKIDSPTSDERRMMVELGTKGLSNVEVDSQEIARGGVSYTVDTLRSLKEKYGDWEFWVIIGMDVFRGLDSWKDYETDLTLANFAVTSRPGDQFPADKSQLSLSIRRLVEEEAEQEFLLNTGKSINFIQLDDIDVSASEIRKRVRSGMEIGEFVPEDVASYIRAGSIYKSKQEALDNPVEFLNYGVGCLEEGKAIRIEAYDVRTISQPSEFTVIASGTSSKHVQSLAERTVTSIGERFGIKPLSFEGQTQGRWVLLDYGFIIIHIFYDFVREDYRLEELWRGGTRV